MRTLYLLICIASAGLIFTSCKKEDKNSTPESSIMGKWKGDKTVNILSRNGLVVETDTSYWKAPDYLSLEFKKDNRLVYNEFYENELDTDELYFKVIGDKLTVMQEENDPYSEEYTIKVNGNKLVLSGTLFTELDGDATWKLNSEIHLKK